MLYYNKYRQKIQDDNAFLCLAGKGFQTGSGENFREFLYEPMHKNSQLSVISRALYQIIQKLKKILVNILTCGEKRCIMTSSVKME